MTADDLPPVRLELTELGSALTVSLPEDVAAALSASRVVTVERPVRGDAFLVGPTNWVGVAQIAGIEVWVRPKVPIDRLFFLLGYALDPRGWWRAGDVELGEHRDLLPALAQAFVFQAERALKQGLLQGYRETEDSLSVLRGRLRAAEQLTRRHGLAVPLEVRYDEYTSDIAENQLLLSAARRLLRLPGVSASVRKALLRITARLTDATPLVSGHALPSWRPSRLNTRYHGALRLAEIVLRASSVDQSHGSVQVDGFLFNMAKVFEDFVTVALGELLGKEGGRARRQASEYLDEAEQIRMAPDLVWYDEAGCPLAVVDAKYKAEKPSGFPDADLYQLLAYATALNLPVGHLVYAKGNESVQRHSVRNANIEIALHTLDLARSPAELLAQVADLAASMAGQAADEGRAVVSELRWSSVH